MTWLSERWAAFSAAAGTRRYIIGAIITVVLALYDFVVPWGANTSLRSLFGIPSWAIAIIVALALIGYWLLEYLVQLRRRMRGARSELANLRTKGVALRNEGQSMGDKATFVKWERETLEWNDEVIAAIKKLNEADAVLFSTLDVVPQPRIPIEYAAGGGADLILSASHEKAYREHDYRLKRLGEMLYELWER